MIDKILNYYSTKYEDIKTVLKDLYEIEVKMEYIKLCLDNNKEVYLMEDDGWEYNSYFRLKVVKIIDFDKGYVKVIDTSISAKDNPIFKEVEVKYLDIEEIHNLNKYKGE